MIRLENTNTYVLNSPKELAYFHQNATALPRPMSPLEVWSAIMQHPQPFMKLAFKIRDTISKRFGVEEIGGFSGQSRNHVQVGDKLDFFLVEHVDDHSLILTARDTHLDVMTSLSVEDGNAFTITSSVETHNWFGRAYMLPVGIAHKVIVWNMLRRLRRVL